MVLSATTHVVQWGDAHVWKVGGKVFAIADWDEGELTGITFKTSPTEYEFLVQVEGVRPAPYLASRGFTWVQHYCLPGLGDDLLRGHLEDSHRVVAEGPTKKKRVELGLEPDPTNIGYGHGPEGDLDRIVDDSWDPPVSMAVRLVSVADVCLQHVGQANYLRGMCRR